MIKVLIVEDDPMVAEINRQYTESVPGFEVVAIARNGEQAEKMLMTKNVQLLILDIYMPKCNGVQLMKMIRKNEWPVDVIMVTASKDPAHIGEVLQMGAVDYLVKPFEFKRLKQALENYRKRRMTLEEFDDVTQDDIDRLLSSQGEEELEDVYEKGIHPKTLHTIRQYLEPLPVSVDATQVSEGVGVARGTARRYLEYLEKRGELELEISYDTGGRPRHLYRRRHALK